VGTSLRLLASPEQEQCTCKQEARWGTLSAEGMCLCEVEAPRKAPLSLRRVERCKWKAAPALVEEAMCALPLEPVVMDRPAACTSQVPPMEASLVTWSWGVVR
jgi:hypothetical protein